MDSNKQKTTRTARPAVTIMDLSPSVRTISNRPAITISRAEFAADCCKSLIIQWVMLETRKLTWCPEVGCMSTSLCLLGSSRCLLPVFRRRTVTFFRWRRLAGIQFHRKGSGGIPPGSLPVLHVKRF
jgi:hypothetical protein